MSHPVALDRARAADVRLALGLSVVSVLWGAAAAVVAIVLGFASGSLATIGFGLDSAIDSSASVVLVWRFHVEGRDPVRTAGVEHLAARVVGAVLIVAAFALTVGAGRSLIGGGAVHTLPAQTLLLVASLVVLPPLAISKATVARRLASRALANDALLTGAGAVLALVALLAAAAAGSLGLWWADAVGSIVIAGVLAREGWAAVNEASAAA